LSLTILQLKPFRNFV